MSEPMKKLENAKKMLDMGLINQAEMSVFGNLKQELACESRSMFFLGKGKYCVFQEV